MQEKYIAEYGEGVTLRTDMGMGYLTNIIPDNTIIYGKPQALYLGMWGTMEIDRDTTTDRNTGATNLRVWMDADTSVPQPANFATITDLA